MLKKHGTAPGRFTWQTLYDVDGTPDNFVSNSAPYQEYSADITPALAISS